MEPSDNSFSTRNVIGLLVIGASITSVGVFLGVPALIVVLSIIGIIILHELGHYLVARATGMKVTEFYLGFGPRVWSFRRGETTFGVKAILLGAYVRILGMNAVEQVSHAEEHRSYRAQPAWQRVAVAAAGSTAHFVLAILLIFSFLMVNGRTETALADDWTIKDVIPDSPAAEAGLQPGDRVLRIGAEQIGNWEEFRAALPRPGEPSEWLLLRNGRMVTVDVTTAIGGIGGSAGYVGVTTTNATVTVDVGPMESAMLSFEEFGFILKESVIGMGQVFTPDRMADFFGDVFTGGDTAAQQSGDASAAPAENDDERLVSILGVVGFGADVADDSYVNLLIFLALINIFIGLFNLIPLPPFDGGHIVIAIYEGIRSRRGNKYMVDVAKIIPVAYVVIALLLLIGIGAAYLDVTDPLRLPDR